MIPALTLLAVLAMPPQDVTYTQINKNSPTQKLVFTWDGKDVDGNPISTERAVFVFRAHPAPSPPPPPVEVQTALPPAVGVNEFLVNKAAANLPLGTYAWTMRIVGQGGVAGDESDPFYVEVLGQSPQGKPGKATDLGVKGSP